LWFSKQRKGMNALDRSLLKSGAKAFVMIGSSENADMRYITRFITSDPVVYVKKGGELGTIIVSQMELERAARESAVAAMSRAEAGLVRISDKEKDRWRAYAIMIHDLAEGPVLLPPDFPYAIGKYLSDLSTVFMDSGTIPAMRARKKMDEISEIRKAQMATEAAMDRAMRMIRKSRPMKGVLHLGHAPLTSERVRNAMHRDLLERGYLTRDTIVSCGKDTAVPHISGNGPLLSGEPIVIDVFPRSIRSGYFTDMTRTVSKGKPSDEILDMYRAVKEAQDIAGAMFKSGITGADVHQAVVDYFHDRGYKSGAEGFIHNLGHGVGLEVHELPVIGPAGGKLQQRNVVTDEPGLYYAKIGGVRLENIGVIKRVGIDWITEFRRELVL
jgi:Xaa-Pro aminopeptidase